MKKAAAYESTLHAALQDNEVAAEYLMDALEDKNITVFYSALKDVVDARIGMSGLARAAKLNRESLYKAFSERGNPEFATIRRVLAPLGLRLYVGPGKQTRKRHGKRAATAR